MTERNIKIFFHLVAQSLIIALAYNTVDTSQRWASSVQFAVVALVLIGLFFAYLISFLVTLSTHKTVAKTFGRLLWLTPLLWVVFWYSLIQINASIEADKSVKYIAKSDEHQADYNYTHEILINKLPELLPGYKHLNPVDYVLNSLTFLSPYSDTISVTKCIGAAKEDKDYYITRISIKLPGQFIKDTTYLKEKTIQLLEDFSNDSTLNRVNNDWESYLAGVKDTSNSSDRLETIFEITDPITKAYMGNMQAHKFNHEDFISYRLILYNSYCKLCIPMVEDPSYIPKKE